MLRELGVQQTMLKDTYNLRCKKDAQYESRLVADQIDAIMLDLYPVSWGALRNG